VKGLGWPHARMSGGGGGVGWPVSPDERSPLECADGAAGAESRSDGQLSSFVPEDSRHVLHALPGGVVDGEAPTSSGDRVIVLASAARVAVSSLAGWGGAAPHVTAVGLAWPVVVPGESPAPTLVEDVARVGDLRVVHGSDAPALGGTPEPPAPRVSRETAGEEDQAAPVPGQGAPEHVDRDRDSIEGDETYTASRHDTRESRPVGRTVHTARVHGDGQGDDGSGFVQQGSNVTTDATGGVEQPWSTVTTGSHGYDDSHRVHLVDSLPTVDDSTPLAVEVAEDARRRISLVGRPFPPPPHTRILTVANQKGGVGKTTTTVNVAAAMAQSGLTVLVLDIDPQGNASTALGVDHHQDIPSLYDVVVEQRALAEVLQPCPDIPSLLCAPATIDLAGAEIELVSLVAREVRLQKALREYLGQRRDEGLSQIDYVFIDCPPSLSLLTVNAFVAADEVFIPIQCEYYALEGLSQLLKHIELIRGHLNPTLHVSSILLTMYDGRTRLSSQVADEVRAHFPETVLRTSVPRSVRISEAPSHGQTVMTYDPASSGALSYLGAARELAEQVLTWPEASHQEEQS
jgi:chromosome partitioning protein